MMAAIMANGKFTIAIGLEAVVMRQAGRPQVGLGADIYIEMALTW